MNYVDRFRDPVLSKGMLNELKGSVTESIKIMEVCGTHTMAIFKTGLRSVLPENIQMLSGPGCPVCVTSAAHIDTFVWLAKEPGVRLAVFGDLMRVPGSSGSLADAVSEGARVDVVYSPVDALRLATENQDDIVVLAGIGFETTVPSVAATIIAARNSNIKNFKVFSTHKVMMPALNTLFAGEDKKGKTDGLLCPGHVSAITGTDIYVPLARDFKLPCVVGGFEAADILLAILLLVRQIGDGRAQVENAYGRTVSKKGNKRARDAVEQVFEPEDTEWRGFGIIPKSGLSIRPEFAEFDATPLCTADFTSSTEPAGCICGEILRGMRIPIDCPLFAVRCTPYKPYGPCMVSGEGACAAYFRYEVENE